MPEERAILVRHIPRQLPDDQIEDLFTRFGASGVRILNSKQKKTTSAFVTFRSTMEAQWGVSRLHEMDVMGYRLSAELSNQTIAQEPRGKCDLRDKADQHMGLLKSLHLDKCPPHALKFLYPKPTLHVLLNILSALYEHQKFYTQVLHLMNKMNLPCPFDPAHTRSSKIDHLFVHGKKWTESQLSQTVEELEVVVDLDEQAPEHLESVQTGDAPMETSDTEEEVESEMEDSDDVTTPQAQTPAILNLKRARGGKKALGVKGPRLNDMLALAKRDRLTRGEKRPAGKVFESVSSSTAAQRRKLIQVNVTADLTSISTSSILDQQDTHSFPTIIPDRGSTARSESTILSPTKVSIETSPKNVSEIERSQTQGGDLGEISSKNSSEIHETSSRSERQSSRLSLPSATHPGTESSEQTLPTDPSNPVLAERKKIELNSPLHLELIALAKRGRLCRGVRWPEGEALLDPVAGASHPGTESSEQTLPAGPSDPAFTDQGSAVTPRAADPPQKPDVCSSEGLEEEERVVRVISKERLDSNRLSERDRGFVKAFSNYSAGTPSCRLYVKNLAKTVTQEDVEFVFRRYYLPEYREQGTMFDVRLMQEGRMKGQAFISLQTVQQARQALQETNGFILKDKPMVVQYARSIQAKPAPAPTS